MFGAAAASLPARVMPAPGAGLLPPASGAAAGVLLGGFSVPLEQNSSSSTPGPIAASLSLGEGRSSGLKSGSTPCSTPRRRSRPRAGRHGALCAVAKRPPQPPSPASPAAHASPAVSPSSSQRCRGTGAWLSRNAVCTRWLELLAVLPIPPKPGS
eukprot:scaffold12131_cov112-Isochrysis_galbana.AAC.16